MADGREDPLIATMIDEVMFPIQRKLMLLKSNTSATSALVNASVWSETKSIIYEKINDFGSGKTFYK